MLRQIIKINGLVDEKGLFSLLGNQLGYAHVGDVIKARFSQALALIPDLKITPEGNYTLE